MARTRINSTGSFAKRRYPRKPSGGSEKPKEDTSGTRRRWTLGNTRYGVAEVLLAACAFIALLAAADGLANSGEIYRGVKVAGVSVGGKTPEEASRVVGERLASDAPEEVRMTGAGADLTFDAEELGIGFALGPTIEKAYEVGRTGGVGARISERLRASVGAVDVDADTEYRADVARGAIADLAAELDREPGNAEISLSGNRAEVQEGREGYRIDQAATLQNLQVALGNLEEEARIAGGVVEPEVSTQRAEIAATNINLALEEPLVLRSGDQSWELAPGELASALSVTNGGSNLNLEIEAEQLRQLVPEMYEALQTEPRDAGFTFVDEAVEVVPAQPGQQVAENRLIEELNAGLFEGRHEFEVPVNEGRQPELTTEKAESLKPTELLGKFRTNYETIEDEDGSRTYNLGIAADAIDEAVLAPGEIFSVNDTVAQLDYKEAKVFQEGLIQYAEGGGLCQVASTLYVAAVQAGLEVVERHQHYAMLEYIKPGFDSTVWFGDAYGNGELDSRFKNNTDAYVLLREWVDDDGHMYAEVWGQPTGREVELRSEMVDHTNSSATWVTYKTVKENGEVVEEREAYTDTYRSLGQNEHNDNPYGFDPTWE